tara:strand:+ start:2004 stop:2270 length:267 start_codon:yes stop_codon:yes gene_type:complete
MSKNYIQTKLSTRSVGTIQALIDTEIKKIDDMYSDYKKKLNVANSESDVRLKQSFLKMLKTQKKDLQTTLKELDNGVHLTIHNLYDHV